MAWLDNQTVVILKHLVGNFIAATVLLIAAIGLAYVEKWCVEQKMPEYVCWGSTAIAFTIFAFDGLVICGTTAIVAIKLLKKTYKNEV